ncbi:hypothetical protein GGS26DRAFT_556616 [Hypomontagnella submonticulosa]|nr:hypothetical protein GGS26DRAFT_556616 [Hypomontagnella submonticulosa]
MYYKFAITTLVMAAGLLLPGASSFMLPRDGGVCEQTTADTCKGNGMCHFGDGSSVCCGSNSKGYACGGEKHGCRTYWGREYTNCD